MADYTLRLRRYSPETGDAPYWEDFQVDLDGHRSVLDGILQAKDRTDALDRHPLLVPRRDLRLLRRAHQRQARTSPATCTSTRPPRTPPTA